MLSLLCGGYVGLKGFSLLRRLLRRKIWNGSEVTEVWKGRSSRMMLLWTDSIVWGGVVRVRVLVGVIFRVILMVISFLIIFAAIFVIVMFFMIIFVFMAINFKFPSFIKFVKFFFLFYCLNLYIWLFFLYIIFLYLIIFLQSSIYRFLYNFHNKSRLIKHINIPTWIHWLIINNFLNDLISFSLSN